MLEDASLFSFIGAAFTLVAGGAIGFIVDYFSNHEQRRNEGLAVAHTYRATIDSTRASLSSVMKDDDFLSIYPANLPPDAVYDFRREDWFSVHHALCANLGKIVSLGSERGPDAVARVSQFFQDFKYTRELFAYLLSVQKGAAIKRDLGDEETAALIDEHAMIRQEKLRSRLTALLNLGQQTVEALDEITAQSQPLTLRKALYFLGGTNGRSGSVALAKAMTKDQE